jgi:hypothetical protein
MPSGIGVDVERFGRVVEAVVQHTGAKRPRPLMLSHEIFLGRDTEVEVELLRYRALGPRRRQEVVDVLNGDSCRARPVDQDQPILTGRVRLAGGRGFVSCPVVVAEELAVELG